MKLKFSLLMLLLAVMIMYYACKKIDTARPLKTRPVATIKKTEYARYIDSVGKWHNEYLDVMLTGIYKSGINLLDTIKVNAVVKKHTVAFFRRKGIFNDALASSFTISPVSHKVNPINYSKNAYKILAALHHVMQPGSVGSKKFYKVLFQLKEAALNLEGTEALTIGIPVQVAISSMQYWQNNGEKWFTAMSVRNIRFEGEFNKYTQKKQYAKRGACKLNLYKVGGSDAGGAITGAFAGGLGAGPLGAVAGGVMGASVSSLGNMANQIIECFVPWWPFFIEPIDLSNADLNDPAVLEYIKSLIIAADFLGESFEYVYDSTETFELPLPDTIETNDAWNLDLPDLDNSDYFNNLELN